MTQYLAGVDVGTTGARCMLFDLDGNPVGGHYCDYGATYPRPGWVEQDATLLIAKTMEACRRAVSSSAIDPRRIAAVGFSAQRSVTCPVAADGSPVRPMFSWQDARTSDEVEELRALISAEEYYAQNGLPLGTTWIITKLLWMRKHEPDCLPERHAWCRIRTWCCALLGRTITTPICAVRCSTACGMCIARPGTCRCSSNLV